MSVSVCFFVRKISMLTMRNCGLKLVLTAQMRVVRDTFKEVSDVYVRPWH